MKDKYYYLLLFMVVFISFSCEKEHKTTQIELDEFEVSDHIIIGQTMKTQIENMPNVFSILDTTKYEDAYAYLGTLLHTLKLTALVKHRNNFHWNISIIHDDNIKNAFTLPGGHIYIYTGLLKFLKAEHELIAVLGSEIAYADKALTIKTLKDEYDGVVLGDITLGKKVKNLPEIVESIPVIPFPDRRILTADQYAIELICPFQYDITGLKAFIQRAEAYQIEWIQSKQGEETDMKKRIARIEELSNACGAEGVTNINQYKRKIKNFLP